MTAPLPSAAVLQAAPLLVIPAGEDFFRIIRRAEEEQTQNDAWFFHAKIVGAVNFEPSRPAPRTLVDDAPFLRRRAPHFKEELSFCR